MACVVILFAPEDSALRAGRKLVAERDRRVHGRELHDEAMGAKVCRVEAEPGERPPDEPAVVRDPGRVERGVRTGKLHGAFEEREGQAGVRRTRVPDPASNQDLRISTEPKTLINDDVELEGLGGLVDVGDELGVGVVRVSIPAGAASEKAAEEARAPSEVSDGPGVEHVLDASGGGDRSDGREVC